MNQVWAKRKKIPPSKGVPERQRGRGMLVRFLDNLGVNRMNIPLRRSAFEGGIGCALAIRYLL